MATVGGVQASMLVLGWAATNEDRVVCMSLDMLLEILRTLERLSAELALVRLERNVHTDVRGDVIALDSGGSARIPLAGQVQVVGTLSTNMLLTDMLLDACQSRVPC